MYGRRKSMGTKNLNCTEDECKEKREKFIFLTIDQLSTQIKQCEKCNSGVFKTNAVAAQTYQHISLLWAEKHNQTIGKLH